MHVDARKCTRIYFGGSKSTRHVIKKARDAREARERKLFFWKREIRAGNSWHQAYTCRRMRMHVNTRGCMRMHENARYMQHTTACTRKKRISLSDSWDVRGRRNPGRSHIDPRSNAQSNFMSNFMSIVMSAIAFGGLRKMYHIASLNACGCQHH